MPGWAGSLKGQSHIGQIATCKVESQNVANKIEIRFQGGTQGKEGTLMAYHLTVEEFYGGFQVSNGHKHVLEMAVKFEPES